MPIQTEGVYAQDVLLEEFSQLHCREDAVITNDTGAEADLEPGTILEGTGPYTPANDTTATAILLTSHKNVPIAGSVNGVVLRYGPATVNADKLISLAGTASSQKAALLAAGIVQIAEPTKKTTAVY